MAFSIFRICRCLRVATVSIFMLCVVFSLHFVTHSDDSLLLSRRDIPPGAATVYGSQVAVLEHDVIGLRKETDVAVDMVLQLNKTKIESVAAQVRNITVSPHLAGNRITMLQNGNNGMNIRNITTVKIASERKEMERRVAALGRKVPMLLPRGRHGPHAPLQNVFPKMAEEYQKILNNTPIAKAGPPLRNVTKCLLFGYFRGGTSFGAEVLSQNPRSFYMFEPLHSLEFQYERGARRPRLNTGVSEQIDKVINLKKERQIRLIYGILNCKIDYLFEADPFLFNDNSFLYRDKKLMDEVYSPLKCFDKLKSGAPGQDLCKHHIQQSCSNSSVIAIKENRLRMRQVEALLRLDQDIHVIHYTRDLRGIASSRPYSKIAPRSVKLSIAARSQISELCKYMREDLEIFERLQRLHPHKLFRIKYEDLALNLDTNVNLIYKQLGHDIPEALHKWVNKSTDFAIAKKGKPDLFGTNRNSSEIAYKWRETMMPQVRHDINNITDCAYVLKELEYDL